MKKSDRPLMVAALRERLPPGWRVFERGQMVCVRGPEAPDDRYANQWLLGSGAPFSYPGGQNIISRFEPIAGLDTGFQRQHASFHGVRGYRDLMVNKVLELIANPPLTPTQRAARKRAKGEGQ